MEFENEFFDTTDFEKTSKILGEGQFGKVYVVKNENDDKEYAAKIIKTNGIFNGHQQMLLMREVLILCKLNHPSIVKFYGINFHSFDDPSKLEPTIITEYISNGSLKVILDNEKRSMANEGWTATKKYITLLGISHAMKHMHQHGIVHRDLKPENVLMDDNLYPRICDFGLSRCFSENLSKSIQLVMTKQIGTPLYMAPEILTDDQYPQYVSAIDVYSFSMLAYEIVTGKVPFSENGKPLSLSSLIQKVISGERPNFNEFATEKMQDLISKCWSDDPKERPSFNEIFDQLSSDLTYFDEDVDEEEINNFIDTLNESNSEQKDEMKSKTDELENENEQLKKKLLIFEEETKKKKQINDEQKDKMKSKIDELENENEQLKKKLSALEVETEKKKQINDEQKDEMKSIIIKLENENEQLRKKISALEGESDVKKYDKIENILEDQELSKLLLDFCERKICQEYVLFYYDVKFYKKITDPSSRIKKFIEIRDKYIKDDSPFHINVQLSCLWKVERTKEADLSENVFDELIKKVFCIINCEVLPIFKRTNKFQEFIERKKRIFTKPQDYITKLETENKELTQMNEQLKMKIDNLESKKKSFFHKNKK